ncbi:MAG: hypothetical protein IPM36_19625 [Lewinellaceae bacterium]|nr:hypothetical protein [Lewinellaceae bacterium]
MTSQNLFFALLLLVFSLQTTLTAQAVQLVRDYIPGSTSSFDEDSETPLGIIKNQLIFTQRDNSDKLSLWATDGTAIGTKQIHQPLAFTDPVDFQLIDSFIYFKETFFGNTYLVRSGGTENSKISISIASSDQELLSFLPIKDTIFYLVKYSSGGIQLWYHKISTASGNFIYNDFNESFYQPLEMARLDEHRFVFLAGLQDGRYLFVSDGTYPGTKAIKNLNSGSEFAQAPYMTRVGNKVFFFYKMPITGGGYWLYVTDGTTQGTLALKEFEFVPFSDFRLTRSLLPLQDKFYFRAQPIGNGGNQEELWVSDGTVNGTFSLEPTPGKYTNPSYLTPYNNKLYFKGENFSGVNGLFSTNGSIGSTILEVNGSQIGSGLESIT